MELILNKQTMEEYTRNRIDVSTLNTGVYFAVIKNGSGKSLKSIKILKK